MRISAYAPVKNEAPWIGYSIMAALDHMHEFIYTCAKSDDGTDELLDYIKQKYAGDKLIIMRKPEYDFHPHNRIQYNAAFNDCIAKASGEAVYFLHPDMLIKNPEVIPTIKPDSLAWWTNLTSFAGDFSTKITRGRATRWKNICMKKFGLTYFGAYGSQNEDMFFKAITGDSYIHHGEDFRAYPYKVSDSGLNVDHFCELKSYKRRFEKMKLCMKTLYPGWHENSIEHAASLHPRVTLEERLGQGFEFTKTDDPVPAVIQKYKEEFEKVIGRHT